MATNVREQQTRKDTPDRTHDEVYDHPVASADRASVARTGEPSVVDPVVTPTGGGGVSVYDRNPAQPIDPTLRPATSPTPASPTGETPVSGRVPVEPRSTGSIIGWFIGAVLLIILAYFLVQMIF